MEKKVKTILLLGGFGFIGTNLIKYIENNNLPYKVIVFDKYRRHPCGVESNVIERIYAGDFMDCFMMEKVFEENHIDNVFHCLSSTVPTRAFNAKYDIESNLVPTIGVLDLMVKHGVKKILFVSSGGAVYGGNGLKPHKEDDGLFPISPYGITKIAIEKYLFSYATLYGVEPLVLRLSNPYGKYHFSATQGIVNVALRAALQRQLFIVWGDGTARKDYIFIDDFCRIVFSLIQLNVHSKIFNVASGELLDVNTILNRIKELVPTFQWDYSDPAKLDIPCFELDTTRLRDVIGEQKFVSFEEGLGMLYNWQVENS